MQVKSGTQRRFGIPVKSLEGLLSKKKQGRTFRIKIYKNVRTGLKAAAHERKNKPRITENSKHAKITQRRWQKTTKENHLLHRNCKYAFNKPYLQFISSKYALSLSLFKKKKVF